ncbi:MAG: hypothetical protein GY838_02190 [bacterium]|nr:hypothetical protein [bacterium]
MTDRVAWESTTSEIPHEPWRTLATQIRVSHSVAYGYHHLSASAPLRRRRSFALLNLTKTYRRTRLSASSQRIRPILVEIMKPIRPLPLLMVIALGLALVPGPVDAACGMDSHPDGDPYDEPPIAPYDDPCCSGDLPPADDVGCEPGCQHCSLPCCSGIAMVPPYILGLGHAPTVNGCLLAATSDTPRDTAVLHYRPPQV